MANSIKNPEIWLLDDGRLGHLRQSQALLHGMQSHHPAIQSIPVRNLVVPNRWYQWARPKPLLTEQLGFRPTEQSDLKPLVIGTGSHCASYSRFLSQHFSQAFTVQILNPRAKHEDFSVLIIPEHDGLRLNNTIQMRGSLSLLPEPPVESMPELWPQGEGNKLVILLAGDEAQNQRLLKQMHTLPPGYRIIISVGPRTLQNTVEQVKKQATQQSLKVIAPDDASPVYQGMLHQADQYWVAADSINQLSEVLTVRHQQSIWVTGLQQQGVFNRQRRKRNWITSLLERGEIRWIDDFPVPSNKELIEVSRLFWQAQTDRIARQVLNRYWQSQTAGSEAVEPMP